MMLDHSKGHHVLSHALPWCGAALAVGVCLWAVQMGARMQAALDLEQERAMLAEDREVCAQMTAPVGTAGFLACAMALDDVRRHERERIAARDDGLP